MASGQSLRIVQARLRHLDVLVPLFDRYRQFYGMVTNRPLAESFLRERLTNYDSVVFLATHAGSGKGLGFVQLFASFSSVSAQSLWILNDLFVGREERRRGTGRALMERARQHAVETGAKGLLLSTQIDNRRAQALYEDLGYQRDTEFYNYFLATPAMVPP